MSVSLSVSVSVCLCVCVGVSLRVWVCVYVYQCSISKRRLSNAIAFLECALGVLMEQMEEVQRADWKMPKAQIVNSRLKNANAQIQLTMHEHT